MDGTESVFQQKLVRFTRLKEKLNIRVKQNQNRSSVQAVGLSAIKGFMSAALIFPVYSRLFSDSAGAEPVNPVTPAELTG